MVVFVLYPVFRGGEFPGGNISIEQIRRCGRIIKRLLVGRLITTVPSFSSVINENIRENNGGIIKYLIIGGIIGAVAVVRLGGWIFYDSFIFERAKDRRLLDLKLSGIPSLEGLDELDLDENVDHTIRHISCSRCGEIVNRTSEKTRK